MQSGVSINAASCSAALVPSIVRAVGCRVTPDRRRVRLVFPSTTAIDFLADIRATSKIAVTFVRPSTHRALQIKGTDAAVVDTVPEDARLAEDLCNNFIAELKPLGYDSAVVRAVLDATPSDFVAVEFTPAAAFLQSPGPRAGEPLKANA